jgi:uncharacterized membrane protein YphA (DoxX/SURF4 family)
VIVTQAGSRRVLAWDAVGLVVRLGLAAVWLLSGFEKASDPRETIVAVRSYELLPESLVGTMAATLPYLEISLGVLLVLGFATRLAAWLSAALLLVFIGGVISAAVRGLSIDCGCFGGGGQVAPGATTYTLEILRDVGFLALAGYLIWRPDTPLSIDRFVRLRAESVAGTAAGESVE